MFDLKVNHITILKVCVEILCRLYLDKAQFSAQGLYLGHVEAMTDRSNLGQLLLKDILHVMSGIFLHVFGIPKQCCSQFSVFVNNCVQLKELTQ